MTKGIIIFARNNENYNYAKMAVVCAGFVRNNLKKFDEICLVTDEFTYSSNKDIIDNAFDRVIEQDELNATGNTRRYQDTSGNMIPTTWKNLDRSDVYKISPYDETLVIDADYFIMSPTLDNVWGSSNDFMINSQYRDIAGRHEHEVLYLDDFTIPMVWATVFYFKKSEYAENLFTIIDMIKKNYQYYCALYNAPRGLYRNDFVFSMALHILNASIPNSVPTLPIEYINNSFDLDDIFRVNSAKEIIMYLARKQDNRDFILGLFNNIDLHIMNKNAIDRHYDDFIKYLFTKQEEKEEATV